MEATTSSPSRPATVDLDQGRGECVVGHCVFICGVRTPFAVFAGLANVEVTAAAPKQHLQRQRYVSHFVARAIAWRDRDEWTCQMPGAFGR